VTAIIKTTTVIVSLAGALRPRGIPAAQKAQNSLVLSQRSSQTAAHVKVYRSAREKDSPSPTGEIVSPTKQSMKRSLLFVATRSTTTVTEKSIMQMKIANPAHQGPLKIATQVLPRRKTRARAKAGNGLAAQTVSGVRVKIRCSQQTASFVETKKTTTVTVLLMINVREKNLSNQNPPQNTKKRQTQSLL
tara:strand:- start:15830 stop:16399 length:570 start_codon:yes stop_codon:yes gene_type:complete